MNAQAFVGFTHKHKVSRESLAKEAIHVSDVRSFLAIKECKSVPVVAVDLTENNKDQLIVVGYN